MKISVKLKRWLTDIASIATTEFRNIATSYAILLVLMGGIFVYGLLYNYMYQPNLVRDVPVVVADNSQTALSREYIRLIDATYQVEIIATGIGYPEAKEMMKKNEATGIVYIPSDFENRVAQGAESVFIMYETTSAFLYYLAMQEASTGAMMKLDARYRPEMLVFLPQKDISRITQTQPITVSGTALYNYTEGYGTYLIPAVLMVIIFQTLLMLIGMLSGNERSTGSIADFATQGISFGRVSRIILSKTFVYCVLYAIFSLFLLGLMPVLFDLPNIGNGMHIIMLMIPYLLSSCFFGLAASLFFTDSEAPLLMIAFFSVGLIFLSGVSYPLELMPWYWQAIHYCIPATPATLAFVKLNSMGASMAEIQTEYITLWIQCIFYFILACLTYRYTIKKALKIKTETALIS